MSLSLKDAARRVLAEDGGSGVHDQQGGTKRGIGVPLCSLTPEAPGGPQLQVSPTVGLTLLEADFPFAELSLVARMDRRGRDPAYGAHRWWARRPRSLIRGVLLAAALPRNIDRDDFWSHYSGDGAPLAGLRVHDIFVGGGSTLIEGARLGATPSGSDVDPMSVEIVRQALAPAPSDEVGRVGTALVERLRDDFGHLFPCPRPGWTPLHYFYLRRVRCPECDSHGLLYRNLVISRDVGKVGAVVRDDEVTAFCPRCLGVHQLPSDAESLVCCGAAHSLSSATFGRQQYECPSCAHRSDHGALATGRAELVLLAVEETHPQHRRAVRAPTQAERDVQASAAALLESAPDDFHVPDVGFQQPRSDPRPVSYGLENVRELFSPRQQLILGRAFKLISSWDADENTRRAVRLALSNALTTNNMLCGYATDYGRLSPLFGVRSYCLPALSVELNPLQGDGGRGTLARCVERACRSSGSTVSRYVWDQEAGEPRRLVLPTGSEHVNDPSWSSVAPRPHCRSPWWTPSTSASLTRRTSISSPTTSCPSSTVPGCPTAKSPVLRCCPTPKIRSRVSVPHWGPACARLSRPSGRVAHSPSRTTARPRAPGRQSAAHLTWRMSG